jgi:hypothetical protein
MFLPEKLRSAGGSEGGVRGAFDKLCEQVVQTTSVSPKASPDFEDFLKRIVLEGKAGMNFAALTPAAKDDPVETAPAKSAPTEPHGTCPARTP